MTEIIEFHTFLLILAAAPVLVAAITDLQEFRIPNEASLLLLVLYPVHIWLAPVPIDVIGGFLVAACIFAITLTLHMFDKFGGGDVKFLSVLGLWAGPSFAVDLILTTALAGGILAVVFMSRAGFMIASHLDQPGETKARASLLSARLPYGVAIGCGGLAVIWAQMG